MTQQIHIPPIIEGYSAVRVVWFSASNVPLSVRNPNIALTVGGKKLGDPDVLNPDLDTQLQVQGQLIDQQSTAFTQLRNLARFGLNTGDDFDNGNELITDGESDVAGMSWNKDTEAPAGVMSITLFPRRDYANMMQPEDVLLVYGRADKQSVETLITLVSLDSIRNSRAVDGSGATVSRVAIQGRDLGKVLMETPTVYDQAFGGKVMATFFSQFVKAFTEGFAQGGPSVVVQTMLAVFFSMRQNFVTRALGAELPSDENVTLTVGPLRPWRFPGKKTISMFSFLDISSFVQTPMIGALVADASLLQNAGNLWSLCDMYSNRIVNEFFIDVRDLVDSYDASHKRMGYFAEKFLAVYGSDGSEQRTLNQQIARTTSLVPELLTDEQDRPQFLNDLASTDFVQSGSTAGSHGSVIALVHRQLPYDTFSFYMLPTSLVYETEVFDASLERSSSDVKNFFRVRFPGLVEGVAQDLQFGVTINRSSIERHGIRRLEAESIYPFTNETASGHGFISSYQPTFEYYMSCLTAWHAYNERLYSGSITMRFRPDIRVGTRLTFVYTHRGIVRVVDLYVQRVSHSFSPQPNQSRTVVELVRGIQRQDAMLVGDLAEAHLFWTHEGRSLSPDPFEKVVSEDVLGTATDVSVPSTNLAPGDP
jgi:hypothetical protein